MCGGGFSLPDGPLGVVVLVALYGISGFQIAADASSSAFKFGSNAVQKGTVRLFNLFNPSFLDDKIATLSLRISTGFLRSAKTMSVWYTRRGLFYMLKGDRKKSLEDLSEAINKDPTNFTALFYKASCLIAEKMEPDFVQIEKILVQSLEAFDKQEPENSIKKKFHELEDSLSEAHNNLFITKDSLHSALHTNVVASFFNRQLSEHVSKETRRNERYINALIDLLNEPVTKTSVLNLLAVVLCKLEKFEQAIAVFSTLMKQEGKNTQHLSFYQFNFGLCYLYMKQYEQALAHFEASLQLIPKKSWIKGNMQGKVTRFIHFLKMRKERTLIIEQEKEERDEVAPPFPALPLIPYPFIKGDTMAIIASFLDEKSLQNLKRTSRDLYVFLTKNHDLIRAYRK